MDRPSVAPPGSASSRGVPMVNGAVLRAFVTYYLNAHGPDALQRLFLRLPAEVRSDLDASRPGLGVLPWRWYPATHAHALLDIVTDGLDDAARAAMARDATRVAIETMVRGVYRWVITKLTTPYLYGRFIQRTWATMHDTGKRKITFVGPCAVDSSVTDWGGHHPVLCEVVSATTVAVFEAMGCRNVRAESRTCISRGDDTCSTRIVWDGF